MAKDVDNNYDTTAAKRMKKRDHKIRDAGLSHLKVPMHKDDASKVRSYAKKLYEKRGFSLDTD
jgi:hypothetical protein